MRRSYWVLMLAVALLAGCSSAAAPTPQIVYVTPMPTAVAATAAPTADSALAAARSHILSTLTALQGQADAISSGSDFGDVASVYAAIQAIQRLCNDELDWLNTQPASATEVPAIREYKVRLQVYQPLGQQSMTHFYDGTALGAARQAGSALSELLSLRPDISAIAASQ